MSYNLEIDYVLEAFDAACMIKMARSFLMESPKKGILSITV